MALKDVIGQERALEMLTGTMAKKRVAHAYLFAGEDGVGKKLAALNFAKALNCEKNLNALIIPRNELKNNQRSASRTAYQGADCCDECVPCTKIEKAVHPDVVLVQPEDGEITVGVIRELQEALSYKPFEGRCKVSIINDVETLNQSAANAFLKTLEEPPDSSVLLLVSSMPELLPATIHSRVQRINFPPLPFNKMREFLERNASAGRDFRTEKAVLLSALSGGRPGWALKDDLIEKRDVLFNEFSKLLGRAEEDIWADADSMEEWFEGVNLILRDIAVFKATGGADFLINRDREKEIKKFAKNAELKDILKLSRTLYNIKRLLRFNLNRHITLYNTSLLLKRTFGRINV